MLRELVDDYFARRISRVEYLAQRHILMERIDRDFNGEGITNRPSSDITQPKKAVFTDDADTAITNIPTNIKNTDNR